MQILARDVISHVYLCTWQLNQRTGWERPKEVITHLKEEETNCYKWKRALLWVKITKGAIRSDYDVYWPSDISIHVLKI